jgi:hypothetical protein
MATGHMLEKRVFKGTVQRELRGVKIGINRFLIPYSFAMPQETPSREEHKRYQRL